MINYNVRGTLSEVPLTFILMYFFKEKEVTKYIIKNKHIDNNYYVL